MSEKKYPIYCDRPPTDDFIGVFMGGGGPNQECYCGREHIAIDSDVIIESEIEYYTEMNKEDPEGFIIHRDVDDVRYSYISGKNFVHDCPCNGPRHYEDMFWQNRKQIRQYLTIVKMKLLSDAADVGEWQEDL
jgi:hypothetical protein